MRWGPWALAAGPVVYFVVKWFARRAAQEARVGSMRGSCDLYHSRTEPKTSRPLHLSRRTHPRLPRSHRKAQPDAQRLHHGNGRIRSRTSPSRRARNLIADTISARCTAFLSGSKTSSMSLESALPRPARSSAVRKTIAFPPKTPRSSAACAAEAPSFWASRTCTSLPTAAVR